MLFSMCGFCIERKLEKPFIVTPIRTSIIPETKQNKLGTLDWARSKYGGLLIVK